MVSIKSATSTILLCELVVSCAMIIASLAVVAAQSQSILDGVRSKIKPEAIAVCVLSALVMLTAIVAMIGMSKHRSALILPHLFFSIIACGFHATLSINILADWLRLTGFDGYWLFALVTASLFQMAIWIAISIEVRCYRHAS